MMHIAGVGESRLRYQGDHTFIPVADEDLRFVFSMEDGRAESVIVRDEDRVMQGQRKP